MAGGGIKWRKRAINGTAAVADAKLLWELVSEPQWSNSGGGYKGLCISVRVADEARRELIIEYPFPKGKDGRNLPVPQRPRVTQTHVEKSILGAIEAGWDPSSRGKPFIYYPQDGS